MRIAAIDCGSNSFHLLIADSFGHDQFVVVEDDKSLLYLGAEVATSKKISSTSILRAKRVIKHYKTLIERHNVDLVRCVATSAIRSAENGGKIIELLSKTLGYPIRVISGEQEAQTIFRGISAVSVLPETRILACDMGGGSLELMAGQRHGLEFATSVPLGASRVAKELDVSDPLSQDDIKRIQEKCRDYFADFNKRYPADLFSHIVASSGTLTTLILMARSRIDGFESPLVAQLSATEAELIDLCDLVITLEPKQRKKLLGYDKIRDDYISTAAVIAIEISKLASKEASWLISPYALREGIILNITDNLTEEITDQSVIAQKTVDDLENRMGVFTPTKNNTTHTDGVPLLVKHGRKVEQLSYEIFDALQTIHNLDYKYRNLLGFAARLHDIGETISHSKHDQHGAYILSNIPLAGFSPEDAIILRGIIKWHRTRKPKIRDQYVGHMNETLFNAAQWLTAIVRIADGADAGKSGAVTSLKISVNPDVIFIRCVTDQDCELEMYSARRKRHFLESISGRDVIIEQALSARGVQD